MKENNKKEWFDRIGLIITLTIAIPLIVAFLIMFIQRQFNLGFDINGTILTFVGILATFVVISNYAQVKDVDNKVDIKIRDIKNEYERKIEEFKEHQNEIQQNILKDYKKDSEERINTIKIQIEDLNIKNDVILSAINNFSQSSKNTDTIDVVHLQNLSQKIFEKKQQK